MTRSRRMHQQLLEVHSGGWIYGQRLQEERESNGEPLDFVVLSLDAVRKPPVPQRDRGGIYLPTYLPSIRLSLLRITFHDMQHISPKCSTFPFWQCAALDRADTRRKFLLSLSSPTTTHDACNAFPTRSMPLGGNPRRTPSEQALLDGLSGRDVMEFRNFLADWLHTRNPTVPVTCLVTPPPVRVKQEIYDLSDSLVAVTIEPQRSTAGDLVQTRLIKENGRDAVEILSDSEDGDPAKPGQDWDFEVSETLFRGASRSSSLPAFDSGDLDPYEAADKGPVLGQSDTLWQDANLMPQVIIVERLEFVNQMPLISPILETPTALWAGEEPIRCRHARMTCNGCGACERIDRKLIQINRYDLDPASRNAVLSLLKPTEPMLNMSETPSVPLSLALPARSESNPQLFPDPSYNDFDFSMFLDDPVHPTAQDFTSTPNVDLSAFGYFESTPQPFVDLWENGNAQCLPGQAANRQLKTTLINSRSGPELTLFKAVVMDDVKSWSSFVLKCLHPFLFHDDLSITYPKLRLKKSPLASTVFSNEIKGKNVLVMIIGTSLNGIGLEAARSIAKHVATFSTVTRKRLMDGGVVSLRGRRGRERVAVPRRVCQIGQLFPGDLRGCARAGA
ncbi:hypothetical protein C8R43DRAFT_949303 [Mycena crocata]|nr:hypothetical protein C8R43DRAFT_949303 [Mycena crocata]